MSGAVHLSFFSLRIRLFSRGVIYAIWSMIISGSPASAQQFHNLTMLPEHFFSIASEDTAYVHKLLGSAGYYLPLHSDSALFLYEQAKQLSFRIPYPDGICVALNGISRFYADRGDQTKALAYLREAEVYCKNAFFRARSLTVSWYQSMAIPHTYSGRNDSAVWYLYRSLEFARSLKDTASMLAAYNLLGTVWIHNKDLNNAIRYLEKGEQLALQKPYTDDLALISNNLAIAYGNLGDSTRMLHSLQRAATYARISGNKRQQQKALLNLADYYLKGQQPAEALRHLQEGLSFTKEENHTLRFEFYYGLSNAWHQLGHFRKARTYGLAAEACISGKQLHTFSKAYFFEEQARICDALGDRAGAYHYQKLYTALSDSLNRTSRKGEIDRLETMYRLAEHEKEIAHKEKELLFNAAKIRNRNIWIITISIGALGITAFLFGLYRNSRRRMLLLRQQKEIDELKAMISGEEKERNRIAIDLHDHVGGLLSAAFYNLERIKEENNDMEHSHAFRKIKSLIGEVQYEIRNTAHNLMPDILIHHSLPEAVRIYCADMERDAALRIDVQIQGQFDNLHQDFQLSLYRIIQELVQNILKHAEATHVYVQLHASSTLVSLTVEDNGKGFDPEQATTQGRGLLNIQGRITIMNGRLSLDTNPGKGTSIYIEFDLND